MDTRLKAVQERQQGRALAVPETFEALARQPGLAPVTSNRLVDRRDRSIVQKRPAESEAPQRGRANLVGLGRSLLDAIAGVQA